MKLVAQSLELLLDPVSFWGLSRRTCEEEQVIGGRSRLFQASDEQTGRDKREELPAAFLCGREKTAAAAASWTRRAPGAVRSRRQAGVELGPSHVPQKASMLETDKVHVGVEERHDAKRRSSAGLQDTQWFINPALDSKRWPQRPQTFRYLDGELLPRTQLLRNDHAEPLLPAELQGVGVLAREELERHDAHPNQLVLVEFLEALGDDGAHPLKNNHL